RIGAITVHVAGVLGQHGQYELLERVPPARRLQRTEVGRQSPDDLPDGGRGGRSRPGATGTIDGLPSDGSGSHRGPSLPAQARAKFVNVVMDSRNVRSTLPMGPLRCLAMKISACWRTSGLSGSMSRWMSRTTSASCSICPDSRRSDSWGRLSARASG